MSAETRGAVRKFVEETFMFRARLAALTDEMDLVKQGIVDSAGMLVLISFLEETFAMTVADDDVEPENFGSIAAIAAYVARKTEGTG